ncbi:MAG TPA: NAD(P)H-hydrate dehydratase [Bacillota bacterium]|nr:NAD(P)H-hydrate dehydratase [Bacillota bacterium]
MADAEHLDARVARTLLPPREGAASKAEVGRVVVVAGAPGMDGAAILAARAALRTGVGRVTVFTHPDLVRSVAVAVPEVLVLPFGWVGGHFSRTAADDVAFRADAWRAVVVAGPGLDDLPGSTDFLDELLKGCVRPVVADGAAIKALQGTPVPFPGPRIFTPHPGEASRLLTEGVGQVRGDRPAAALEMARRWRATFVLKGGPALVATAGGRLVDCGGSPGLATPGTGTVLAAVIAGLWALGCSSEGAAQLGAYLVAEAGRICSQRIGPYGFLATEVADAIPAAVAGLHSA